MIQYLKKFVFRKFKDSTIKHHELNYLFWECTTRCNLNCIHCGSDCSKDSKYDDMPMDDFLKAVDTIDQKAKNFIVVFTGGEPLMRKDIELCGKALRKRNARWSIVTNGHLYNEKRHNSLLSAGMGALTISLDGLEESHNWMRNSKESFILALNAIELAASTRRLNFDVVTCVNQKNITELSKIKDLLVSKKVPAWRLFTIIPIGRALQNADLMLSDNQFVELMEFITEQRKHKDIDIKFSCEGFVGKYEPKVRDIFFFCRAGINIGSVLIDGSISACPNISRDFTQGNIYTDNLNEVWQNKFQPFRHREWTKRGRCEHCKDHKDCQGNGFHNWHGEKKNVLVCHKGKIDNASTTVKKITQ